MPFYALQLNSKWEDKPANFQRARELALQAAPEPGSLLALPEMFATGFSCALTRTQEPAQGPTWEFLCKLAEETQCFVTGGLVTSGADGRGLNQAVVLSPEAKELARYTKRHPFTYGPEGTVHAPGEGLALFEWNGLRVAPLICYDLRFPELAREAVQEGAEMLLYLAAWPARRISHWVTLLQARAIENQAYVAGVNRCGQEPETSYCGRSLLVDPQGVIVADASDSETVLRCTVDVNGVRGWRAEFPALKDYLKHGSR